MNVKILLIILMLLFIPIVSAETYIGTSYLNVDEINPDGNSFVNFTTDAYFLDNINVSNNVNIGNDLSIYHSGNDMYFDNSDISIGNFIFRGWDGYQMRNFFNLSSAGANFYSRDITTLGDINGGAFIGTSFTGDTFTGGNFYGNFIGNVTGGTIIGDNITVDSFISNVWKTDNFQIYENDSNLIIADRNGLDWEYFNMDWNTGETTLNGDLNVGTVTADGIVSGTQVYEDYEYHLLGDSPFAEGWVRFAEIKTNIEDNRYQHALFTIEANGDYTHDGEHVGDELYARQNQHAIFYVSANRNTPEGMSITLLSTGVEDSQNVTTYPMFDRLRIVIDNSTDTYGRPIPNPVAYLELHQNNTDEINYRVYLRNSKSWTLYDKDNWNQSDTLPSGFVVGVELDVINNFVIGGYYGNTYVDEYGNFINENTIVGEDGLNITGQLNLEGNLNVNATEYLYDDYYENVIRGGTLFGNPEESYTTSYFDFMVGSGGLGIVDDYSTYTNITYITPFSIDMYSSENMDFTMDGDGNKVISLTKGTDTFNIGVQDFFYADYLGHDLLQATEVTKDGYSGLNITYGFYDDRLSPIKTSNDIFVGDVFFNRNVTMLEGLDITNGITSTDYVQLDTSWTNGTSEGRLQWNSEDGTLEVGLPGGDVNLQIGQEFLIRVKNEETFTIPNGKVVYASSTTGNTKNVKLASYDMNESGNRVVGVATEDILSGQFGYITSIGLVRDINTTGLSGAENVYLGLNGSLSLTPPDAPNKKVVIGIIVREHDTEGQLYVRIKNIPCLEGLSDTYGNPTSDGEFYIWNTTNERFELYNISDLTPEDVWVNVSGDTMTGNLLMGTNDITGVGDLSATNIITNGGYLNINSTEYIFDGYYHNKILGSSIFGSTTNVDNYFDFIIGSTGSFTILEDYGAYSDYASISPNTITLTGSNDKEFTMEKGSDSFSIDLTTNKLDMEYKDIEYLKLISITKDTKSSLNITYGVYDDRIPPATISNDIFIGDVFFNREVTMLDNLNITGNLTIGGELQIGNLVIDQLSATDLNIANDNWISSRNYANTGNINMFKVNVNDTIELGTTMSINSFEFETDSGLVTFADMPVTSSASIGTDEGYYFKLDGNNILGVTAESDGVGGIQNEQVIVNSDLNVTGITNSLLPHMNGFLTQNQTIPVVDTWYNFTWNDTLGDIQGFTISNNQTLTAQYEGHYTIIYKLSVYDSNSTTSDIFAVRIINDDGEMIGSYEQFETSKQDVDEPMINFANVYLEEGHNLTMQYLASSTELQVYSENTYSDYSNIHGWAYIERTNANYGVSSPVTSPTPIPTPIPVPQPAIRDDFQELENIELQDEVIYENIEPQIENIEGVVVI